MVMVVASMAAGCVDNQTSPNAGKVSSIIMTLHDPADTGTPMNPVTSLNAMFDLQAVDDHGAPITSDLDVQFFISFGGVKTGAVGACGSAAPDANPLETIHLAGGQIMGHQVTLPQAFGATTLWIDEPLSGATGASPTIYYRNPFVADVQTPPDLTAINASFCTPFNGKFVIIDKPAMPAGQLVISSVFSDAFVVTDTSYGTYDKFNSIYLYAFGKPPTYIVPGKVLNSFSGNISKFVGFTELNFPLFNVTDETTPLATLPQPAALVWADIGMLPKLISLDGGVVTYTGMECNPLPPNPNNDPNIQKTIDSWNKYSQFVVDGDNTCSALTNFAVELPTKVFGTYDPLQSVMHTVTVTGMLKNNSGQNPVLDANNMPINCDMTHPCAKGTCTEGVCVKNPYNFWTVIPRTPQDVVVQ
jgi:hypothetical protein